MIILQLIADKRILAFETNGNKKFKMINEITNTGNIAIIRNERFINNDIDASVRKHSAVAIDRITLDRPSSSDK